MNKTIDILTIILPIFYAIAVWGYAKNFFKDYLTPRILQNYLLIPLIIVHSIYIFLRTIIFNHPPITTIYEIMTIIAFAIAVIYLIAAYLINAKGAGFFLLTISLIFQTISSLFIENLTEVEPILRSNLLGAHVSCALVGYVALAISAVYGFLYLMLYHNIKSKQFGAFYSKLPNLEIMERMTVISIVIGIIFLGCAIIVGFIWLPRAFETFSYYDPKLLVTIFVWLLYVMGLIAKRFKGIQGRRFMILAIIGSVVSFFSLTIVNIFFTSFHNFH